MNTDYLRVKFRFLTLHTRAASLLLNLQPVALSGLLAATAFIAEALLQDAPQLCLQRHRIKYDTPANY